MPHEYNVLDHFQITDIWAEKNNGVTCFKYRLEKIDLASKSWWAPKGSPDPRPDFSVEMTKNKCMYCAKSSKAIFEKWVCLNSDCAHFWKYENGKSPSKDSKYSRAFLAERTEWSSHILPAYKIKPDLLELGNNDEASFAYSRTGWKGIVCPNCGRCNSRRFWDAWYCETTGCDFKHQISQPVLSPRAVLDGHEVEFSGHAIPRDEYSPLIKSHQSEFQGNWRISTFDLIDGNTVTHFHANKAINDVSRGPSDLFRDLQNNNVMGLQRHEMKTKTGSCLMSHSRSTNTNRVPGKGTVLAQHFAVNYVRLVLHARNVCTNVQPGVSIQLCCCCGLQAL